MTVSGPHRYGRCRLLGSRLPTTVWRRAESNRQPPPCKVCTLGSSTCAAALVSGEGTPNLSRESALTQGLGYICGYRRKMMDLISEHVAAPDDPAERG